MNKKLPIYNIEIDPNEDMFVNYVSIVEHPAIERNFLAFSKDQKNIHKYTFSNNEKMQLLGVAMVPNEAIYRNQNNEEFYVEFTKESIEKIVHTFMQKGLTNNLNVEHSKQSAHSYIFQSFIVDEKIKAPTELGDVPNGSWVIGVQITDHSLWQDIKDGKRNGVIFP